jgi:hypothetical protein
MLDEADEGSQRGHEASTGVVLGQTAKFAADHLAVIVEEPLQDLALSGGADNVFIGKRQAGRHIDTVR